MNLQNVLLFLTVQETGSLAKAARQLNISPMAASRRLSSLEDELGTRLLQRTTRSVSLTQEGIEFLPYAQAMLEAEEGARAALSPKMKKGATGLLRITVPSGFGRRNVLPLIPSLLRNNPELQVDIQFNEAIESIVSRGLDVAIRIAPLRDSNLIAKKIIDNPRILCASPEYLKKRGIPKKLNHLSQHDCLRLTNVMQWTFASDGKHKSVSVDGRFSSNNVEGIRELCVCGIGIAQLTYWDVKKELNEGKLIEIALDDVQPQQLSIWAVLPSTRYLPLRVSVFIESLKNSLLK